MDHAIILVRVLDLVGTFVFAISGAALGVKERLDLFGVLVLAFVTAVVGGITRDMVIGAIPPASIATWHDLALTILAGVLVFRLSWIFEKLEHPVHFFDAVGLGVFAVAGTQKALAYGINWPMATVLGMVSGIGGGIVRDTLMARVPIVLRAEIYAIAAFAAALVVVIGGSMGLPPVIAAFAGIALCVFLRVMALYRGWKLPVAFVKEDSTPALHLGDELAGGRTDDNGHADPATGESRRR